MNAFEIITLIYMVISSFVIGILCVNSNVLEKDIFNQSYNLDDLKQTCKIKLDHLGDLHRSNFDKIIEIDGKLTGELLVINERLDKLEGKE